MQAPSAQFEEMFEAIKRYAAVQGAFRPQDAMRAVSEGADVDPVLMVEVLSALRAECTVTRDKAGDLWLLRAGTRRKVLGGDDYGSTVVATSAVETPVQQALDGAGDFAPETVARHIAGPGDIARMSDIAVTLDRAGPTAPAYGHLVALRSALNAARQVARTDKLLAAGFYGREKELADLAGWINRPQEKAPLRTWHVSGLPGIGKSYLLEKVIQQARLEMQPVLVRLDFDRSSLNVLDAYAFFEEISRQMADALPEAAVQLRDMRLQSAEEKAGQKGRSARRGLPRGLLGAMAEAAGRSERLVLVVLDTLEVLRARGETHVMTLFEHLDQLAGYGMRRLCVISAGRGDALDPVPERVEGRTRLEGLEDWAAEALLKQRGVAEKLWPRILPLAQGNPLLLTLAGKALEGDFDEAELPQGASAETIGGYLYRAILSRVPRRLTRVANEGLILQAINVPALAEVVAPALGLRMDSAQAADILRELADQHWLVEPEPGGWMRHRADVRRAFLPLIYADSPVEVAEINRRAAAWFAERDAVKALYHALQLERVGEALPEVPEDLARQFSEIMLDELPPRARDAVLQARGMRSGFGRAGSGPAQEASRGAVGQPPHPSISDEMAAGAEVAGADEADAGMLRYDARRRRVVFGADAGAEAPDKRAVKDFELMLEAGDLREAHYVLENAFAGRFGADSAAGRLMMCHQWLAGAWATARRIFDLQGPEALQHAMEDSPQLVGRVMLEIAAEFDFDALVQRLDGKAFMAQAVEVYRASSRVGLQGGALDFALLAANTEERAISEVEQSLNVLAPYLQGESEQLAAVARHAADEARDRIGLHVENGMGHGRMVAPLNPYVTPLFAYAGLVAGPGLERYLTAMRAALPDAGRLFAPEVGGYAALEGRLAQEAGETVEALGAMGLTALWAAGYAFYHTQPDVPTLARAAERWRRTVSGQWSYGRRRPPGWVSQQMVDEASREMLAHLLAADKPVEAARAALLFWADPGGKGAAGRAQLLRRMAGRYARASTTTGSAEDRLTQLLNAGVSSALAPPLAVLAAHGIALKALFGKDFDNI